MMRNPVEVMAESIKDKPHSFGFIRRATGLSLSDEQFVEMIEKNPGRFRLVRFTSKDEQGNPIQPSRPGVKIIPLEAS